MVGKLVPVKGGRWYIIPQLAIYTTYILPSGGLYATYHLLGEPETTIEYVGAHNYIYFRIMLPQLPTSKAIYRCCKVHF